jgi:hypothetical protein
VTFSKSELISLASSTESCEEAKIWVSSAYRQGVVVFRQFGISLIYSKLGTTTGEVMTLVEPRK